MSWLEKIQKKSNTEKMRLMWTVLIISAILLVILWILTSKISKNLPKDTTLFQTVGKGFKDIKNNYGK